MREIKFRIWDTFYKDWISPGYGAITSTGAILCYRSGGLMGGEWVSEDDGGLIAQQYTGLKDKNGKEIYEGDLVKHPRLGLECVDWGEHQGGFLPFSCWSAYEDNFEAAECEIVGNICETMAAPTVENKDFF